MIKVLTMALLLGMSSLAMADSHTLTDATGREVTLPLEPKRIVVLNEPVATVPLIELGLDPVASLGRNDDGSYQFGADFIDSVLGKGKRKPKGFGLNGQIDLERLTALKPDVIVGTEFDLDKAGQLSGVAPVYLQKFASGDLSNFAIERELARITGRENIFETLLADYQKRVGETKALAADSYAGKTYLLILVADQLSVIGSGSGATQALEDAGFKKFTVDESAAVNGQPTLMMKLSPERFGKLNPDLLVIISSWAQTEHDEVTIKKAVGKVVPGWEQFVQPAKEGRVLYLDSSKVFTPSFASAKHTLDALDAWHKAK
ncbi:ABC transporter substrate-binding protein [Brucella sp. TWI432]